LPAPAPLAVCVAAGLFNLGQGVLRPTLPLYLQLVLAASYRMVTLIPMVFGAGKWVASLPTGYLLDQVGRRPLMTSGLVLIAACDIASAMTSSYGVFLGFRALGGVGWAMFGAVATVTMVDRPVARQRGQAVSLLLMSETLGLLVGSAAGGWLYQGFGVVSPFVFEAACMIAGALVVGPWASPAASGPVPKRAPRDWWVLGVALRTPGVLLMGLTNAVLIAIQTGVLVFLFPLYLANRGGLSPETVGMIVSLGVVGRLLALWIGGRVSDRWGRLRVMIPGMLAYAALLGSATFVTHPGALGFWSFAIGGIGGFVATIPTALIGDQVPPALQGVAIGWLRMMTDTGQILGPLVMGTVADAVDLSTPFLLGAALLVTMAWRCHRRALVMSASTHISSDGQRLPDTPVDRKGSAGGGVPGRRPSR
jgi:MFS family permease